MGGAPTEGRIWAVTYGRSRKNLGRARVLMVESVDGQDCFIGRNSVTRAEWSLNPNSLVSCK